MSDSLPYRIAALCYLFDERGRTLLLHRRREPNQHLYSPVGGKLEQEHGESPTACAVREINEETGLVVQPAELHLTGVVSESGFDDAMHWMMFLYEVTHPVRLERDTCDEGSLEWHDMAALDELPIPETDRLVIWPLFRRYRNRFFAAHLQCAGGSITWRLEQPAPDACAWSTLSANLLK